jgi:hypothetical protein
VGFFLVFACPRKHATLALRFSGLYDIDIGQAHCITAGGRGPYVSVNDSGVSSVEGCRRGWMQ